MRPPEDTSTPQALATPQDGAALMRHQSEDVEWARQVRRGLLANEPGLGKTRSAIEATAGAKTLVVAPAVLVNSGTWQDEVNRWADDPSRFTIVSYTSLCDRQTVVNKQGRKVSKVVPRRRPEYLGPYDAVVIDEAHYAKGRDVSWTLATFDAVKQADMFIGMTGTPIPNWAHELFTILRMIHVKESAPGKRFGSFWRWAEEWFDCSPNRFSNGAPVAGELWRCTPACTLRPAFDPCQHYVKFAEANLGEHWRRVKRDDVLDLPPITNPPQRVLVPLDPSTKRLYAKLKKEFAATLQSGDRVLAWSSGELNVMLDKLTVSEWMLSRSGKPRGGKLDQLRFDLEGRSRPTFVLAHYTDVVEACAEVAESTGARSAYVHGKQSAAATRAAIRGFQEGKFDVLVGSLEKVAEGLTLTQADMAIFVEMSYKPYRNQQARDRIYRIGQERPVTIRQYLTPYTIDEGKRDLLEKKNDRQMRYLSAAEFLAHA